MISQLKSASKKEGSSKYDLKRQGIIDQPSSGLSVNPWLVLRFPLGEDDTKLGFGNTHWCQFSVSSALNHLHMYVSRFSVSASQSSLADWHAVQDLINQSVTVRWTQDNPMGRAHRIMRYNFRKTI